MKDNNEERYEEEKEVDRKEEDNEGEGYNSYLMKGVIYGVVLLTVILAVIFLGSVIGPSKEPEQEDRYDTYSDGSAAMFHFLRNREKLITLYKADNITEDQMQEYVNSSLDIINSVLSDSEISQEAIEGYNNSLKEMPFIDYDDYKLKSSGENFRRGLKGCLIAGIYQQIVDFYWLQIPKEKYDAFKVIVYDNLYDFSDKAEESHKMMVDYAKKLIEDYIGDPAEVLASTEWRTFTGMPEK